MRISTAIKERLHQNAVRTRAIEQQPKLNKVQQIELEYLQMEAQTFERMLSQLKKSWWKQILRKHLFFTMILLGMSLYVVSISRVFDQMDLSKVEQWEFAVTAMPFWMMMALVPMAVITLFSSRDK